MRDDYFVRIRDGRRKVYDYRQDLAENGFQFFNRSKKNKYWEKEMNSKKEIDFWKGFAKKHGLTIEVENALYSRNSTYRNDFFAHYKPVWKDRYFCIYCGKMLSPKKIEVDHIIPVHQAKKKWYVKRMIKKKHWNGVNDYRNLGASCHRCNRLKGCRMNGWVFRGMIGKSNVYQVIRWGVRLLTLIFAICILISLLF